MKKGIYIVKVIIFTFLLNTQNLFSQSMGELDEKMQTAYKNRNYAEAINFATTRLMAWPWAADKNNIYNFRGTCYFFMEKFNEALSDYTNSINLKPDKTNYFNRGNTYLSLKEYDKAISDLTKSIEFDTNYLDAYISRSNAYYKQKLYNKSIEDDNKVIELSPNDYNGYFGRALCYLGQAKYPEAIPDLDKTIQLKPDLPNGHGERGMANYYLGNYSQAITDLEKCISLDKQFESSLRNYINDAKSKIKSDKNQNAKQKEEPKINKQNENQNLPETAGSLLKKIEAELRLGYYKSVIEKCDKFLTEYKTDINFDRALYLRGRGNYGLTDYNKAIDDFTSALNLKENADYYYFRGLCYYNKKSWAEAIQDLTKSVNLVPGQDNYNALGNVYFKIKIYEDAIYFYTKSDEHNKNNITEVMDNLYVRNLDSRGDAYFKLGKYTEAISDWKKLREYEKSNTAYYNKKIEEAESKMK